MLGARLASLCICLVHMHSSVLASPSGPTTSETADRFEHVIDSVVMAFREGDEEADVFV